MGTFQNLTIQQGASFAFEFTLSNADGSPRDLTDIEIASKMRKAYASPNATTFTVHTPSPEEGTIKLTLTREETLAIREGRYVYDVVVLDLDGEDVRVLEGIVSVTPGVTREESELPVEDIPLPYPSHLSNNQIIGGV